MISIIIVNFRNPPLLKLCLTSIARVLPSSEETEIIVVDSESTPETRNVVRTFMAHCPCRILLAPFDENIGYTKGVNEGIRRASGAHICILNPDIIMLSGTLENLAKYLNEHPSVGLVGPQLLHFDDTIQDSGFRFYTPLIIAARRLPIPFRSRIEKSFIIRPSHPTRPTEVDWLMGSALMTTRRAIDQIGLLDEKLFLYFSEVDLAHRFWENGMSVVYLPSARTYHAHQRQSHAGHGLFDIFARKETRWHIADAVRYFRKHGVQGIRPTSPNNQSSGQIQLIA